MPETVMPVSALLASTDPPPAPVKPLAALLLEEARALHAKGRDPRFLPADIASGDVARRLGIDIEGLVAALKDLAARDLVAPTRGGGLELRDLEGLIRLATTGPDGGSKLPRAA